MEDPCIRAQRIVSETYDGEPHDPNDIQQARIHCASCPECEEFVRTLAAVRRTPQAKAPRHVVERALTGVREEAEADAAAAAAAAALAASAADQTEAAMAEEQASATVTSDTGQAREETAKRLTHSPWFVWGGWAAAATAVLVMGGFMTLRGASYIAGEAESADERGGMIAQDPAPAPQADGSSESFGSAEKSTASAEEARFITVNGFVYSLEGETDVDRSSATTIGTTITSLDTSERPEHYFVLSVGDEAVAIEQDGEFRRFELVTRSFEGQQFALESDPLTSFGQWPKLPAGRSVPTSEDGSPYYSEAGQDDSGVSVFVPQGDDPVNGFAVAPGTPPTDPARGNPNWTWWSPASQVVF